MSQTTLLIQILTIVLTAGLATFGSWFVSRTTAATARKTAEEDRKRHARYLAIRVVCILDEFAGDCGSVVTDYGVQTPDGESTPAVPLPTLTYPEDVDWKTIEPELMYAILGFPTEIQRAYALVDFVASEIATGPDYDEVFEERIRRYGKLGLDAMDLIDRIRGAYGIPDRPGDQIVRRLIANRILQLDRSAAQEALIGRQGAMPDLPPVR